MSGGLLREEMERRGTCRLSSRGSQTGAESLSGEATLAGLRGIPGGEQEEQS